MNHNEQKVLEQAACWDKRVEHPFNNVWHIDVHCKVCVGGGGGGTTIVCIVSQHFASYARRPYVSVYANSRIQVPHQMLHVHTRTISERA